MTIIPNTIIEDEGIKKYLQKRGLIKQYRKAKMYILNGFGKQTNLSERQPKGSNIRYFRINNQCRARCSFDDDNDLRVFKIDNHST